MRTHVAIAFVAGALALGGCDTPRSPLQAHDLQLAAKNLHALAAEADLLAQQVASRSVTREFTWVHQHALGEEALKLAGELDKPVPAELRGAQEKLLALDGRYAGAVHRIATERARPQELAQLREALRDIAREAQALEQVS